MGHLTLAMPPFQKFLRGHVRDCPWEHACQIWSLWLWLFWRSCPLVWLTGSLRTDRHTANENITSAIHPTHLAEVITSGSLYKNNNSRQTMLPFQNYHSLAVLLINLLSATWKKRPHTAVEADSFSSLTSRWFGWLDSWLLGIMHKAYLLTLRT